MPTAFVAMIYGSVLSMFCAIAATLMAAFFLYPPIYSLYVADPREVGELILFVLLLYRAGWQSVRYYLRR